MRGSITHAKIGGDTADVCEIQITYNNPKNSELSVKLPLYDEKFTSLQENDPKIRDLHYKVKKEHITNFILSIITYYLDPL